MNELLAQCRKHDEAAIATLVRRYRAKAVDLAGAIAKDDHLAEDAVQEAFVSALARLDTLRDDSAFWGWFRQIIRTECVRILRKRKEQVRAEPPEVADRSPSPREHAHRQDLRQIVRTAVASLPEVTRRAAEMFYLEERQCIEIGESLGVPEGTVKRRLYDARSQLQHMLLGYVPETAPVDRPPEITFPL